MAWQITKHVVRVLLSVAIALAIVGKAPTSFEASAWLAALIAYHRVSFRFAGLAIMQVKERVRSELWFHRLARTAELAGFDSGLLPPLLRALELNQGHRSYPELFGCDEELAELEAESDKLERNTRVYSVSEAVLETVLVLALLASLAAIGPFQ